MVLKCAIIGCSNRKDREKDLQYYRLPAVIKNQGIECEKLSDDRRREWLANINQNFKDKNIDNIRICSAHFISGKRAELYDRSNPDWCPTQRLRMEGNVQENSLGTTPSVSRYNRVQDRKRRKLELFVETNHESDNTSSSTSVEKTTNVSSQTEVDGTHLKGMDCEINALRLEIKTLKEEKEMNDNRYSEKDFANNDEKVKNFTGLCKFTLLMTLFQYLEPFMQSSDALDKFKCLVLTLMRLRLNLSVLFLSHEFKISKSSVSRIFSNVTDVMYQRMKPFVHWPDRESLQKTMPMQFRKHFGKKCAVIIDCFEVFIERPSNLKARAETWSSYKHHNTVKFLIGITPQGTISFISKAWGGRVSDKYITEHSGFLNKLLPGDLILADRGFDIRDSVGAMCAQVNIPAFTKGKDQLSPADIETTRKLANVRIHVERVIGTVRQKYTILNGTIPISFLKSAPENNITMIDKTAHVCCSLVNLNDSVVGFE
ncbi:uncharacterized protein LOC132721334 [Ruditapes philippinarum]|uniref:uncharacterized protein LOC132721334 n=1 Tax=Ruditapes philippinarum TaxID=129788 RepID=UPI00295B761A|nr:uncharacterized protein LOC132721334 [Ruditapes philippinarum]